LFTADEERVEQNIGDQQSPSRLGFARLRFGADLEREFAAYWFEHSLLFTRLAIVLAATLYAIFGVLDVAVVRDEAPTIWLIRLIYCAVAAGFFLFTFTGAYRRVMQPALCVLSVITGVGIVAMVAVVPPEKGALYYVGILLAIQWSYAVVQLRFGWATAAAVAVVAAYELTAVWHRPASVEVFINNNFFLLSTVIIGMLAGYTIERGVRSDFIQRRLIDDQRAQLAVQNRDLDSALQATLEEVKAKARELQLSRARIVATADHERRKIERNLHDGAQQHLVSLAVQLNLARALVDDDAEVAPLLDGLSAGVKETLGELRALAHGIYPPLLMESGLAVALGAAAGRCPLPTAVHAEVGRYRGEIEASVYFCVLEALQNAAKHAPGASVAIRLWEERGSLRFDVTDDGPGMAAGSKDLGHGFVNMSDRLGAIGGDVAWESKPGEGVRVCGSVPLDPAPVTLAIDFTPRVPA
jgi:signal transduction histidine kinase